MASAFYSDEQKQLMEGCRAAAKERIAPRVREIDQNDRLPAENAGDKHAGSWYAVPGDQPTSHGGASMDSEFPLGVRMVFAGAGVVCFVFAYLIGFKERVNLIAGYDASKVANRKGLCRWIAFWLVPAGIYGAAYPWVFKPSRPPAPPWDLLVVFAVFAVIMMVGAQRYKKRG